MPNELYRDFIDGKADEIINSLGGTITPAPANAELYRDFLDRKFDDVINAIGNVKIKSFTYKGNGNTTNNIQFSDKPTIILSISGKISSYIYDTKNITLEKTKLVMQSTYNNNVGQAVIDCNYDDVTNILTLTGSNSTTALNNTNTVYTVYYI